MRIWARGLTAELQMAAALGVYDAHAVPPGPEIDSCWMYYVVFMCFLCLFSAAID